MSSLQEGRSNGHAEQGRSRLVIRVLIAEDMHMVRGALIALLNLEPDIEVVAEVASGDDILPAARRNRPDVAVIDIALPGKDGITAAAELHGQLPECRTLILTGLGRPGMLRKALIARVDGFVLKDAPADRLANAVRGIAAGCRVIDSDLALAAWDGADCPLSGREIEVLQLAAGGANAVDIAAQLYLSIGTVRNHLTTIVYKLNARNRVDAVRIATESGWL
jgi:two-component system, NarL family, response regulator DesR